MTTIENKLNLCLKSLNLSTLDDKEVAYLKEEDNSESDKESEDNNLFSLNLSVQEKIKYELLINQTIEYRFNLLIDSKLDKIISKKFKNEKIQLQNKIISHNKIIEKNNEYRKSLESNKKKIQLKESELQIKENELQIKEKLINDSEAKLNQKIKNFDIEEKKNKEKLELEFNKLNELKKKLFESEKENKYIRINVGGKIFETTENTLKESSDYFNALLSNNWKTLKDTNGYLFVDRSPELFSNILKIIRGNDSKISLDCNLENELEYYAINYVKEEDSNY